MSKPRLLDLFCGAGGAAKGYQRAGFYVAGVDIANQPRYCGDRFVQADALVAADLLASFGHMAGESFDAIHASPPCQAHSSLRTLWKEREHEDLVAPTRDLLIASGLPYVIENVPGAPLREPAVLCGSAVGLGTNGRQLRRHRLFETNWPLMVPPCNHSGQVVGVYGHGGGGQMTRGYKGTGQEYRDAMEMPWATKAEIAQAIPPAYTELIGHQLMQHVRARSAA